MSKTFQLHVEVKKMAEAYTTSCQRRGRHHASFFFFQTTGWTLWMLMAEMQLNELENLFIIPVWNRPVAQLGATNCWL